jgi:copper(I)-binding protein
MKRIASVLFVFIGVLLLSGCQQTGFTVKDAWARPAAQGENSAVYFVIDNTKAQADTLLSASTDVATAAELHESVLKSDGTTEMQMQDSVPIPADSIVEFSPGGFHVMLINLPKALNVGDTFTLTLNFQNAGEKQLTVPVKAP